MKIVFNGGQRFDVTEQRDRVMLNFKSDNDGYVLFWFENRPISVNESEEPAVVCQSKLQGTHPVSDLAPDTLYTFCMMEATATTLSPFDCVSIRTRPEYGKQIWLKREDKMLFYCVIVVAGVVLLVGSSCVTIGCLKRNGHPLTNAAQRKMKPGGDFVDGPPKLPKRISTITGRSVPQKP